LTRKEAFSPVLLLLGVIVLGLFPNVSATTSSVFFQQGFIGSQTPQVVLRGGTAGTGTIYANETSAKVSLTHARAISYRSNTGTNLLNSPKERTWNGTAWSASETEMPTAGSNVLWIRAAFCPISSRYYEKTIVTLSSDGYLDAYVWNGSSWKTTNNIGQVNTAAATYQSFDIAYESTSGDAMLVYALLSSDGTKDLAYRIWNGTDWSQEAYINDPGHATHANYRWVELESNPTGGSNEIALIAIDETNADCNGWIWNGDVWGNFQELENKLSNVRTNKLMALAYEQNSGEAMFVWAYSNYMESRKWSGTSWENELSPVNIGTLSVRWIQLKADPTSNRLMAITIDGGYDLNSVYWDGSAWASPIEHDADITHIDRRSADFDWEPSGSKGLLVWSTATDSVSYRTFTAPSTWGSTSTASNPGTHPWIQLRMYPRDIDGAVKILGATLNSNFDLFGFRWNGTALTFEATAFTSDTTTTVYECFDITFRLLGDPLHYDNVLQVANQAADSYKVNLTLYQSSNIGRLLNATISFHDGSTSNQIIINDGVTTQSEGPQYDLAGSSTIYIRISNLQVSTAETSYLYVYLRILSPSTSTYSLFIITFEIT